MTRKNRYPWVMDRWPNPPVEVSPENFVTQEQAAERLGVSLIAVGLFIAQGRILPATLEGAPGVKKDSVDTERIRRRDFGYRVKAFIRGLIHFVCL